MIRSESEAPYLTTTKTEQEKLEKKRARDDATIRRALKILETRMMVSSDIMSTPDMVKDFLKLRLGQLPYEVFGVVFLTNRHTVIDTAEIFRGTINSASVHPREIVRDCITHNATAVIFYHNHPSGNPEPSQADQRITDRLHNALALIDVQVLDHVVIGHTSHVSFAERGLI